MWEEQVTVRSIGSCMENDSPRSPGAAAPGTGDRGRRVIPVDVGDGHVGKQSPIGGIRVVLSIPLLEDSPQVGHENLWLLGPGLQIERLFLAFRAAIILSHEVEAFRRPVASRRCSRRGQDLEKYVRQSHEDGEYDPHSSSSVMQVDKPMLPASCPY